MTTVSVEHYVAMAPDVPSLFGDPEPAAPVDTPFPAADATSEAQEAPPPPAEPVPAKKRGVKRAATAADAAEVNASPPEDTLETSDTSPEQPTTATELVPTVATQELQTKPEDLQTAAEAVTLRPLVGLIMGSQSDWETMRHAHETLSQLGVSHECRIVSAHRTPHLLSEYASSAEERGIEVLIAGAGGAAHLPGMAAAFTVVPVLGVPVESHSLKGMDSLLSIAQMPGGVPVGTLAIGKAGAINAALLAVAILSNSRPDLRAALHQFRQEQTNRVLADTLPL